MVSVVVVDHAAVSWMRSQFDQPKFAGIVAVNQRKKHHNIITTRNSHVSTQNSIISQGNKKQTKRDATRNNTSSWALSSSEGHIMPRNNVQ
jgi:hypothetical protein